MAQCLLSVLRTVEDVLSLLGQNPLTGVGAALTRRAGASARPVAAHASALLQQTIITHARGAVSRLYAACAHYTVIRRAALETRGLTVVSAYLPRVSVSRLYFDLGTHSPPTRI
jgi:uncharacterized phage protein gp47/JayE